MEYPIFYIHVELYILEKLGYIFQLLCNSLKVLWMVMTIHLKTSFVALWFLAEFLSVHGV